MDFTETNSTSSEPTPSVNGLGNPLSVVSVLVTLLAILAIIIIYCGFKKRRQQSRWMKRLKMTEDKINHLARSVKNLSKASEECVESISLETIEEISPSHPQLVTNVDTVSLEVNINNSLQSTTSLSSDQGLTVSPVSISSRPTDGTVSYTNGYTAVDYRNNHSTSTGSSPYSTHPLTLTAEVNDPSIYCNGSIDINETQNEPLNDNIERLSTTSSLSMYTCYTELQNCTVTNTATEDCADDEEWV